MCVCWYMSFGRMHILSGIGLRVSLIECTVIVRWPHFKLEIIQTVGQDAYRLDPGLGQIAEINCADPSTCCRPIQNRLLAIILKMVRNENFVLKIQMFKCCVLSTQKNSYSIPTRHSDYKVTGQWRCSHCWQLQAAQWLSCQLQCSHRAVGS